MAKIITPNEQSQPSQPKIDITASKPVKCGQCDYDVFLPAVKMRKISKLLAGTDKDVLLPLDVMVCGNCGEVLDEMIPRELKALGQKDGE